MEESTKKSWKEIRYTSNDGLTLYARHYGRSGGKGRPVLCLPGLTRNSRDFHDLAMFLSHHPTRPREVFCPDFRGRGESDYDPNWHNYSPFTELLDVLDLITILGLERVGVVGTSRGGIIAMLMGTVRPNVIASLVLNDIGPVIETAGLARIMGYAGKIPSTQNWNEAVDLVRAMNKRFFPKLTERDWLQLAQQWFNEENGRIVPFYDPNLGRALSDIDVTQKVPTMWSQFDVLKNTPTLVLRGEYSDLLSVKTVTEMVQRHSQLATFTIRAQGHAPLLKDRFSIGLISDFLRETDPDFAETPEDASVPKPLAHAVPNKNAPSDGEAAEQAT
jgi:pimeloyl-ACP methyl ester carboxylesterase